MTFNFGIIVYGISIPRKDNWKFEQLFLNHQKIELLRGIEKNCDLDEIQFYEKLYDELIIVKYIKSGEDYDENKINEISEDKINKYNILYMNCIKHLYQRNLYKSCVKDLYKPSLRSNLDDYFEEEYHNNIFPLPCCSFDNEENIIIGIPLQIPKEFLITNIDFQNNNIDISNLNSNFEYIDYKKVFSNPSFVLEMINNLTEDIKNEFEFIIEDILYEHSDYLRKILIVPNNCINCN